MTFSDPKTALHDRSDLVKSTIYPGLEDAHEELTEVFEEMRGQLDKEMKRIVELRKVLEDDPGESRLLDMVHTDGQIHSTSSIPSQH